MKHDEFKFKTFEGLQLFGQSWQPENQPKAVICLLTRRAEYHGLARGNFHKKNF